jgi:hypothetical protein
MKYLHMATLVASTVLATPAYSLSAILLTGVTNEIWAGSATLGFEFRVRSPSYIDEVGAYDRYGTGLPVPVTIGIWTLDGTLLTSTTIEPGDGTFSGGFSWVPIEPLLLRPETHYVVGAYSTDYATATIRGYGTGIVRGVVSIWRDRYSSEAEFSFPANTGGNIGRAYLGPNINIVRAPVPEPANWALMIGGFAIAGAAFRSMRVRAEYVMA